MKSQILCARGALLRLQSALTKLNASIRARYPPSHPLRSKVERALSGTINDAPSEIITFAHCGEDAACACKDLGEDPLDIFTDGMAELVDEAASWAGEPKLSATAVPQYPKAITLIEQHLIVEIETASQLFFEAVLAIPGVKRIRLQHAEEEFWKRYQRAQRALILAKKDLSPEIKTRTILCRKLPECVARHVISYLR